ncbi:MAG TPA: hypothetical protein VFI90_02785 [Rubrobacter sp.]|nr:hypothetical protein [Rubrobacter sp.]
MMKLPVVIAVTELVMMAVIGCAQDTGNTPSDNTPPSSTDLSTSPRSSGERAMTAEQTSSFYRIPVQAQEFRGGGVLEGAEKHTEGAVYDYARGTWEKASPVEQTRHRFSKRIEEGDKVEIADQRGTTEGYYGEQLRTVHVVRDGRVVALMFYKEGEEGGGWLLDECESCGEF